MHELSIALSIVEGAEEELARQAGGRVCAVHLRLGPLAGVVKEALLFSFELACQDTPLEGATLVIEDIPLRIRCPQCQRECAAVSIQCLACADCGTPATEVLCGTEMELSALELQA